ncbi:hypothetical protein DCS_05390 [Drechmeria coniospora]|uniref:Uncharacterized protein n=1 Tax=Drechmeria coniospora TaxID=98403 RepID=A0A151GMN7_DRECN|nr:hypothetical protein DCS_05390 [Drechmeria coniospora]KYK58377.1 hypothetical protein DCS_05390 [Drechmeria coniospora]
MNPPWDCVVMTPLGGNPRRRKPAAVCQSWYAAAAAASLVADHSAALRECCAVKPIIIAPCPSLPAGARLAATSSLDLGSAGGPTNARLADAVSTRNPRPGLSRKRRGDDAPSACAPITASTPSIHPRGKNASSAGTRQTCVRCAGRRVPVRLEHRGGGACRSPARPSRIWLAAGTSDRLIWADARSPSTGCHHTTSARPRRRGGNHEKRAGRRSPSSLRGRPARRASVGEACISFLEPSPLLRPRRRAEAERS